MTQSPTHPGLFRGAAAGPNVLYVSEELVRASWDALRVTAAAHVEGVLLWATPASFYSSPIQIVTTVVLPRQRVGPGSYEIPRDGVREMGRSLRGAGLVNVAQLHTHPGDSVRHSPWDNSHSFSQRDGAISIVWPRYGLELPDIEDWGVHECRNHTWIRLSKDAAARRLQVLPSKLDLRIPLEWMKDEEGEDDV